MTESCKSPGITNTTTTSAGITTTTTTSPDITNTTTTSPDITTTSTSSAGVIITGGWKVEVFNLHTNKTCQLPDLPGPGRSSHSLCGHLLCGGISSTNNEDSSTLQSCLMLNPLTGDFTPTSVTLREKRYNHLCWDVEGENGPILLMGGSYSRSSTELVSSDGSSSSASFTLTYDT